MAQSDSQLRTYTANNADASFGDLAARLSEQASRLVRDEFALAQAQAEAKEKAKRLGVGVGKFGMSGVLAMFGGMSATAAAVLGLANVLPGWLAALAVAAVLFMVAGIVALSGKRSVRRAAPLVPTEAVRSAKADVAAVRQAVKR